MWIIADEQLEGRGRLGRTWVSKPGNLYTTLLLPVTACPAILPQLSFVVALAIRQATASLLPSAPVSLKWPNDCLIAGAKYSGVLLEALVPPCIALGIGINIAHAPENLNRSVTHLNAFGDAFTPNDVQQALDHSFQHWFAIWNKNAGFEEIRQAWLQHCGHINAEVTVHRASGAATGICVGLAEDGAMLLKHLTTTLKIHSGDIVAPPGAA